MKKYDKEFLEELCKNSYSYSEVLMKAGRKPSGGGSLVTLKKKIEEYQIDTSHFTGQRWHFSPNHNEKISREIYPLEEVFKKDSKVAQKVLRGYVERHNLLEYKCESCGCDGNWNGGKISLEIHHKDGNNKNNEITNLCYICPNCHALTNTYRGKNKKSNLVRRDYTPTT